MKNVNTSDAGIAFSMDAFRLSLFEKSIRAAIKKPNEIPQPDRNPESVPAEEPEPKVWPKKEPEIQPEKEPPTIPPPAPIEIPQPQSWY